MCLSLDKILRTFFGPYSACFQLRIGNEVTRVTTVRSNEIRLGFLILKPHPLPQQEEAINRLFWQFDAKLTTLHLSKYNHVHGTRIVNV